MASAATPSLSAPGAADPCPPRFNAAAYCVAAPAARHPGKDALIAVDGAAPERPGERRSFAEIEDAVRRAAEALRAAGVRVGDRVLIWLGDGPEFPIAYFGAMAAGAAAVPLSAQLSPREIETIARDAAPAVALLTPDAPALDLSGARRLGFPALQESAPGEIADSAAEDPALLVYTSGSSGSPKGVLHAHRAIWARRMMRAGWHDIGPEDRVMHAGAFNWTYTLGVGLSDPWSMGATAIINAGAREPAQWPRLAAAWRPTVFAAVPGVYRRILKYGSDLQDGFASLRHGVVAGEKLSPEILSAWHAETGKPLLEALGMSEVSTYISGSPTRPADPGWTGWPQPGRRVAVLNAQGAPAPRGEEGDLAVHNSDPGLMLGYWGRAAETGAAYRGEWFITGDRAEMRADGAVAYRGRADDQMNAQGYRVAPLEVEEAMQSHPSVAECAAAELPVADGLSLIALWVAPTPGQPLSKAALLAHAATQLAAYKIPKEMFELPALPRSPNGKLLRRRLPTSGARKLE